MESNLIHWWELPRTAHLGLSKRFLLMLRRKRVSLEYTQSKLGEIMGVHEATIRYWEKDKRRPNIENLMKLLNILKIHRTKIYGNLEFIKGEGHSKKIVKPQLPYNEKSEHIQILAHGFFDGTEAHATDKFNGSLIYQSTNEIEQNLFKNLIEKSEFGLFKLSKSNNGQYSLPAVLTQLLMKHYNIYNLSSRRAKFSNYIVNKFKKEKSLRNSILNAAYIDEGSCGKEKVRDNLCVYSSCNPKLINQISTILKLSKYRFFINQGKTAWSIYLYAGSLRQFNKEILISLPKFYYKRKNVEILLKRQEKMIKILHQVNNILKLIKKQKQIRIKEIQNLFKIHEASARRRVNRLIKSGDLIKISHGRYIYNKLDTK